MSARSLVRLLAAGAALLLVGSPAGSATLSFAFLDPVGDQSGPGMLPGIDLTRLDFVFDDVTGAYRITLTATPEAPFLTRFRVNVNLYNPDADAGLVAFPSFFQDNQNDFVLLVPQLTLTLAGVDSGLTRRERGDRVASSSGPFGTPRGVFAFSAGVQGNTPPWGDFLSDPGFDATVIVPEPGSAALLALGLVALGAGRRRSRSLLTERDMDRT